MSKPNSFEILANSMAKDWAKQCEELIRTWDEYKGFKSSTFKLDWSPRRVSSRGGWYNGPGINIGMSPATRHRQEGSVYRQYEYPGYDSDPVIGGFYSISLVHSVGLHVCHEMAHAVQYYADRVLNKKMDKPHGESFKIPYREIRVNLLNPTLGSVKYQEVLKNEYKKLCTFK